MIVAKSGGQIPHGPSDSEVRTFVREQSGSIGRGQGSMDELDPEVRKLRRSQALEKKNSRFSDPDPDEVMGQTATGSSPDREIIRRRTLLCLEQARDAEAAVDRSRTGKQMWCAIQRKMKAISLFHQVVDNADSVVLQEELMKMPMFQTCSVDFTRALSNCMGVTVVPPRTDIVIAGSQIACLQWVLRGSVSVRIAGQEARRLGPNQHWGETLLLGLEKRWSVSLRTVVKSTIVTLGRDAFETLLRSFPAEDSFFGKITLGYEKSAQESHDLNPCYLFHGLSPLALRLVEGVIPRQIYFPGDVLINEGDTGNELFILVQGSVNITLAGRVIRHEERVRTCSVSGVATMYPEYPPVFGELALIGLQQIRSATVTADAVCLVRALHRSNYVQTIADKGAAVLQRVGNLSARYQGLNGKTCLKDVGIFKDVGCSAEFLDFLSTNLEDRVFMEGHTIIDEDLPDDRCMYIVLEGSLRILKQGEEVATVSAGAVIGEIAAFGLESRRSATVVAKDECYLSCLHQPVVVRGLELFPEDRYKILQVALTRLSGSTVNVSEGTLALLLSGKTTSQSARLELFTDMLRSTELFEAAGIAFIKDLSEASIDRIYMPSDYIVQDGKRGNSMFVMLSGEAGVYKNNSQIAVVGSGSVSGELAMLGVSLVRTSSIQAHQICCMWELVQAKAMVLLERHPKARKHFISIILNHLQTSVPPLILSLPLLYDFDTKFRTLLGLWCEKRVYFPGHSIVREGTNGRRLCIINLGRATLEKKGITIRTYDSGSYFGTNLLLGDPVHKVYLGTLIALQTCHVVSISRQVYLQALEKYPEVGPAKRLETTERQAVVELNEMIRRVSSKKLVLKRYGNILGSEVNAFFLTDLERLQKFWTAWACEARQRKELRERHARERAHALKGMDTWVKKKKEAVARAHESREAMLHSSNSFDECEAVASPAELAAFFRHRAKGKLANRSPDPFFEKWPEPRPSPFYSLNLWDVLARAADEDKPAPASARQNGMVPKGGTLLPALHSARGAREAQAASVLSRPTARKHTRLAADLAGKKASSCTDTSSSGGPVVKPPLPGLNSDPSRVAPGHELIE